MCWTKISGRKFSFFSVLVGYVLHEAQNELRKFSSSARLLLISWHPSWILNILVWINLIKNSQNFLLIFDRVLYQCIINRYQQGGMQNRGAHCSCLQGIMTKNTKARVFKTRKASNFILYFVLIRINIS